MLVGLVVTHGVGDARRVLMVTETETKEWLGKRAGMKSFPMETCEHGESHQQTLSRLLTQELPGMVSCLQINRKQVGRYQVVKHTWLLVFHATSKDLVLPSEGQCHYDVKDHQWVSLMTVLDCEDLRQGAYEPLFDVHQGRRGVVCGECRMPPCFIVHQQ